MKRDGGFEMNETIDAEYPASTPEYWMRRLQDGREEWRCLENTLSDLHSELAALREDKAILDWLEAHPCDIGPRPDWVIGLINGGTKRYGTGKTLRDAARAAMKGDERNAAHMSDEDDILP